jgi:hypothetical protein
MNLQGADSSAEKPTPSSIPGQKSTRSAINQHHKKPTKQLIQLQESPTANKPSPPIKSSTSIQNKLKQNN